MQRYWYKYFVYLSLVFLIVALYKADYLVIPEITSFYYLIGSFVFMFGGFAADALSWKSILNTSNFRASTKECFASVGLSIFAKYIPGKVLVIVGRAAYIAEQMSYPLGRFSLLSLNAQFISLWVGLTLGTFGLFILGELLVWKWLILFLWISLTVIIFSKAVHVLLEKAIVFIRRKEILIPQLNVISVLKVMPWFLVCWGCWGVGFYFLASSLQTQHIPIVAALIYPLCGTLGSLAVIAPGGIGVREGLITGCLVMTGLTVTEAAAVSVASRLWFLIGEIFIFIYGWILDFRKQI